MMMWPSTTPNRLLQDEARTMIVATTLTGHLHIVAEMTTTMTGPDETETETEIEERTKIAEEITEIVMIIEEVRSKMITERRVPTLKRRWMKMKTLKVEVCPKRTGTSKFDFENLF